MGEMKEQVGVKYWDPEKEGDSIKGVIRACNRGDFGMQYVIEQENKEKIVTPSHKFLQSRMMNAVEGKKVEITFTGEEPAKKAGHSPTKMYKVLLEE